MGPSGADQLGRHLGQIKEAEDRVAGCPCYCRLEDEQASGCGRPACLSFWAFRFCRERAHEETEDVVTTPSGPKSLVLVPQPERRRQTLHWHNARGVWEPQREPFGSMRTTLQGTHGTSKGPGAAAQGVCSECAHDHHQPGH